MNIILEVGGEDLKDDGENWEILTETSTTKPCSSGEEGWHYSHFFECEHGSRYYIKLEGQQAAQMIRLMEALEDSEDVQNVHANFDIDQKTLEEVAVERLRLTGFTPVSLLFSITRCHHPTFQHHGGKVCGKAESYSPNLLLTNTFSTLHWIGCALYESSRELDLREDASRQVARRSRFGAVPRARASAHPRGKVLVTSRKLKRQAHRLIPVRLCACSATISAMSAVAALS